MMFWQPQPDDGNRRVEAVDRQFAVIPPQPLQPCSVVLYEAWLAILCRSASKDVVKALLAAGPRGRHPSIKDVNKHGLTPLGEALVAGRCDVADLLVIEASV